MLRPASGELAIGIDSSTTTTVSEAVIELTAPGFFALDEHNRPGTVDDRDRLVVPAASELPQWMHEMQLELVGTQLMDVPEGLPEGMIAYNPSGLIIEIDDDGSETCIVLMRCEPEEGHVFASMVVAYTVDPHNLGAPPRLYTTPRSRARSAEPDPTDELMLANLSGNLRQAQEAQREKRYLPQGVIGVVGEDGAAARVKVRNSETGAIEKKWLVSATYAYADPAKESGIGFGTRFWLVERIEDLHPGLEPLAWAPSEKDVRFAADPEPDSTAATVLGRPSPVFYRGAVSAARLQDPSQLCAGTLQQAVLVSERYHPFDAPPDASVKGACNGAVPLNLAVLESPDTPRNPGDVHLLVVGHNATNIGPRVEDGRVVVDGFRYETTLAVQALRMHPAGYRQPGAYTRLGVLAGVEDFLSTQSKGGGVDTGQVTFPGGLAQDSEGRVRPLRQAGREGSSRAHEIYALPGGLRDSRAAIGFFACRPGLLSWGAPPLVHT